MDFIHYSWYKLFEMKERLIEVLENLLPNMPKRGGKSKNNKKKNKNKRTLKKDIFINDNLFNTMTK